jgi:uracil-DNA glycosylase family 4
MRRTGRVDPSWVERANLLDKIIVACGLDREEVFIANTLKCRPPDNRDPLSRWKSTCCLPYLVGARLS